MKDEQNEERYGVAELADAAGVSVRTVRYYIAEGLLPPPIVAGARSAYTRDHLDRLRVIGRLKDAFLPLKEIRRQLAAMDERAIRQLAAETASTSAIPAPPATVEQPLTAPDRASPAPPAHHRIEEHDSATSYIRRLLAPPHVPAATPVPPPRQAPPSEEEASWRRIRLGDDAELLIREEAYRRQRDKVDWLIDWARKVLG